MLSDDVAPKPTEQVIDLPDPSLPEHRNRCGITAPLFPEKIPILRESTPTRIAVGRSGPRPRTWASLLMRADHAVTQDALMRGVSPSLLEELGLFTVESRARDRVEYLKRPDLGRRLSDPSREILRERCRIRPDVQVFAGDGLSAAAIEHNLPHIIPVIRHGIDSAGLSLGTPFFVTNARVGLLNDVNAILDAEVCILLIGERPGLARAESMSIYMAHRPRPGDTDAKRDAICNIYQGGLNPLEAGALAVDLALRMRRHHKSGVPLKLAEAG